MSACLLLLALAASCVDTPVLSPAANAMQIATQESTPAVADPWVAEDKLQHFALSFAATQMAYGGLRTVADPGGALTGAVATGLALGLAKEVNDVRIGRPFSLKDLAWDAAGVALATLFIRQID